MRKIAFIILYLLVLSPSLYAINVVFRLDDPTVQCDSAHQRIIELFLEKEVPLSVAVIPCNREEQSYTPDDSVYLSLLHSDGIEICLHGLTHVNYGDGEFGNLSKDETHRRIQKGKEVLSQYFDQEIITFAPPFNATNAYVPECLLANGLTILSGDKSQDYSSISDYCGLTLYPETLGELMQNGVWNAAKQCISENHIGHALSVIVFHKCDLPDEAAWQQLSDLLDYCKQRKDVKLYTYTSLYRSGEISNSNRLKANLQSCRLKPFVLNKGVLYPTWVCYAVHALNALLYTLLAIIGFIVLLIGGRRSKYSKYYVSAMCIYAVAIFCIVWFHVLGPLKFSAIMLAMNILPILILYLMKHKKISL